jgi:hypothetical protein
MYCRRLKNEESLYQRPVRGLAVYTSLYLRDVAHKPTQEICAGARVECQVQHPASFFFFLSFFLFFPLFILQRLKAV